VRAVPRLCEFYPGICLQLRKKHGETSVRLRKPQPENSIHITKTHKQTSLIQLLHSPINRTRSPHYIQLLHPPINRTRSPHYIHTFYNKFFKIFHNPVAGSCSPSTSIRVKISILRTFNNQLLKPQRVQPPYLRGAPASFVFRTSHNVVHLDRLFVSSAPYSHLP
jgi:hypothetical protein